MVLERAEIMIQPGRMEEFLTFFRETVLPLTAQFTGLIAFRALRGVEDADSVMFLAEWESIEAHLASRPEPAHEQFRQYVRPFISGAKTTVHFTPI
ncbi:MAG: antibiotic biosynthesis monooxygenase [Sphingomonadales bacterium]|nr:antibiotic biosynthesis monooxygenase [Sphingomonadales bacterium]